MSVPLTAIAEANQEVKDIVIENEQTGWWHQAENGSDRLYI